MKQVIKLIFKLSTVGAAISISYAKGIRPITSFNSP